MPSLTYTKNMEVTILRNITKVYPHMIKIVVYNEPKLFLRPTNRVGRRIEREDYTPSVSSLSRTKMLVQDIVLCNDFELFCTFTFNPSKVDSFSFNACRHKMSVWLHRQSERSKQLGKDFKYLIIPEQHKSGAWHFHALISGYTGSLHASGLKTSTLRDIYNITSFRSGFTTAVEITDKDGVSNYITKYITKSFITQFNKKRFFSSHNLIRPVRSLNSSVFSKTLPLFRQHVYSSGDREEYIINL